MAVDFVPYGAYEDIINILGKWKVMDMKSLSDFCSYELKYFNLLHKVRKLESHGLVKSVLLGRKDKHIYLTNKGLKYTGHDYTYEICDENITHDLITGRVLKELIKTSHFIDGKMFHEVVVENIFPDAEVKGVKDNVRYQLALEIELTQKSESRVKEKYRKYGRERTYNYVLFITKKETLFNTYKRYLEEMNSESQEAVILMFDKNLSVKKFNQKDAICFYQGKTTTFNKLFEDQK
ncbi:MAG: hypothetical protein K9K67_15660 [Bacteriovoracaceae bacterium]|nr:hypothetical protein [Bacteriovoracaceae bacterium]